MIDLILRVGGIGVCSLVLIGCICRIDIMGRHSKLGWKALYITLAPFAAGVMFELMSGKMPEWYVCIGVAGVALHIILTRKLWRDGAPPETMLGEP